MQPDHAGHTTEIYRSRWLAECDERAFMLFAVGLGSAIARDEGEYALLVEQQDAAAAFDHLRRYEVERLHRSRPPLQPPRRLHDHAWVGSLAYAAILIVVAFVISNGVWRLDAFDVGELEAGRVRSGEWWRVWTALTLHLDAAHLVANTAAGIWFGYLASRLTGTGNAWLLVVLGAGLANGIEALLAPASHRSVGASTAVFTALGLLSAYSWRTRVALAQQWPQRWALRWSPLIAGVLLLAWTGTGGESLDQPGAGASQRVDVAAHVLGFLAGVLAGAGASVGRVSRCLDRTPQWLTGLLALAPIVLAWMAALNS
jgi:rhomboid protease GluP